MLVGTALTTTPVATLNVTPAADSYSLSQAEVKARVNVVGPKSAMKPKSPDILDIWINELIEKESNNRTGVKILDVNGRHSYGCLQFQYGTLASYAGRYGLLDEGAPIEPLLYDCAFQKMLTKRMIQENPDNWKHWFTSVIVKGLGLPPVGELITKM